VPFLRLTRDRRGFENTFLLHADHPGAKPRLLYWYRTAPGVLLGRQALDEDAIRTIEENHPDIEFDWPAILALSEVMTPEDEPAVVAVRPNRKRRRDPRRDFRDAERDTAVEPVDPTDQEPEPTSEPLEPLEPLEPMDPAERPRSSLVDELAGREVARALRARYAEIRGRIESLDGDRAAWLARAEAINPDAWQTPEAVLLGVSNAGATYEKLKSELG